MKKNCKNCLSTNSWNGCGLFDMDGSNCSWWKDMFQSGSCVEIKQPQYEFYLNGKRTNQYAKGIIQKKIDDEIFEVKLLCNGENYTVKREWLKLIK